jgi:type III restriction enzyme
MLNVGWDVKSVYVIASLRASVSDLLTEQTLGRGLRLPFGTSTGLEILDGLEVLGHEKYEELLRKAGVLNERFVDVRTRAILRQNVQGQYVPQLTITQVSTPVAPAPRRPRTATAPASARHPPPSPASRWSPASRTTPSRRARSCCC